MSIKYTLVVYEFYTCCFVFRYYNTYYAFTLNVLWVTKILIFTSRLSCVVHETIHPALQTSQNRLSGIRYIGETIPRDGQILDDHEYQEIKSLGSRNTRDKGNKESAKERTQVGNGGLAPGVCPHLFHLGMGTAQETTAAEGNNISHCSIQNKGNWPGRI